MRPTRNWRRCQNECRVTTHLFTNKARRYQVVQMRIGFRYRTISTIPNAIEAGLETWRMPNPTFYASNNSSVRCCGHTNFNRSSWRQSHPNTPFKRVEVSRIFKQHAPWRIHLLFPLNSTIGNPTWLLVTDLSYLARNVIHNNVISIWRAIYRSGIIPSITTLCFVRPAIISSCTLASVFAKSRTSCSFQPRSPSSPWILSSIFTSRLPSLFVPNREPHRVPPYRNA